MILDEFLLPVFPDPLSQHTNITPTMNTFVQIIGYVKISIAYILTSSEREELHVPVV